MRTTGNGFLFIAPLRVRVEVISYTWRLLIFKSVASSCTVRISIALTSATLCRRQRGSLFGKNLRDAFLCQFIGETLAAPLA